MFFSNYQKIFGIAVCLGERDFEKDNFFNKFILNDITPNIKGKLKMIVTFLINSQFSLLIISIRKIQTGKKEIQIIKVE